MLHLWLQLYCDSNELEILLMPLKIIILIVVSNNRCHPLYIYYEPDTLLGIFIPH
jgi:hypothetical protein